MFYEEGMSLGLYKVFGEVCDCQALAAGSRDNVLPKRDNEPSFQWNLSQKKVDKC